MFAGMKIIFVWGFLYHFYSIEKKYWVTYQDIYFIKYLIILFDILKALKLAFYFL